MPKVPIKVHQVSESVFAAGRGLEATVNALKIKRGTDFEPRTLSQGDMKSMKAAKKIGGVRPQITQSFESHLKVMKAIQGKKFPCIFYYGEVT